MIQNDQDSELTIQINLHNQTKNDMIDSNEWDRKIVIVNLEHRKSHNLKFIKEVIANFNFYNEQKPLFIFSYCN